MKHTLKPFLECTSIKNSKLSEIIEKFNKIGVEIEDYSFQKKNLCLEMKIPADRLDLKTHFYFFEDSLIYLKLQKRKKWESIKKCYSKILKPKKRKETFLKSICNIELSKKKSITENYFKNFGITEQNYLKECYFLTNCPEAEKKHLLSFHNFLNLYAKEFTTKYKKISLCKNNTSNKILYLRKAFLKKILSKNNLISFNFNIFPFKLVGEDNFKLFFLIPFYRKDLNREIDLIEEYCKCSGYEDLKVYYPSLKLVKINKKNYILNLIRNYLLHENYTEVFTNSLNKYKGKNTISLINPLNKDLENMQDNLSSNHINLLYKIQEKTNEQNQIFEIARLFKKKEGEIKEGDFLQCSTLEKIDSKELLNTWLKKKSDFDRFFDHIHFLNIRSFLQIEKKEKKIEEKAILYKLNREVLAQLSLFKNEVNEKYYTFTFQLNLNLLFKNFDLPKTKKINLISKYPSIEKDLSFFSSKVINFYLLKKEILEKYPIVKNLLFFDIYANKKLKKVGIRLSFQSYDQTLTNSEIEREIDKIIIDLKQNYYLTKAN